jgi:sporulation protein YlmC with PRC-barrel domain
MISERREEENMMTGSKSTGLKGATLTSAGALLVGVLAVAGMSPALGQERGLHQDRGPQMERGLPTGAERQQLATEQYVVRVTQFFDVPVIASDGQVLGAIEDLLIADDGQFDALIVRPPDANDLRWQIDWDAAQPLVHLEQVVLDIPSTDTDQLGEFYGPVAGTMGTVDSVLATKLLEATVTDHLQNTLGRVIDLRVDVEGEVLMVLFGSPRGLADVVRGDDELGDPTLMQVPWESIEVHTYLPRDLAAGNADPLGPFIVVTGEGVGEQEPAPAEETGGAFIR